MRWDILATELWWRNRRWKRWRNMKWMTDQLGERRIPIHQGRPQPLLLPPQADIGLLDRTARQTPTKTSIAAIHDLFHICFNFVAGSHFSVSVNLGVLPIFCSRPEKVNGTGVVICKASERWDCFNRYRIGHNRWRTNTGYRDPNLNRGRRCIDRDGETFIGQIFSGRSAMGTGKYEFQLSCCLLPEGKSSPPLIPPESTVTVAVPFCTWLPFHFSKKNAWNESYKWRIQFRMNFLRWRN
ncbi:unnamed protein product [Lactuca virosa]|uniref:Uncharacterized protein n=1 Tax=Lactuca virosa TaxID=75947 RepID=A0AAU9MGJ7_9ASTR|nr:unnamed protein product [Lactuca virosa]